MTINTTMTKCMKCGNDYDKSLEITLNNQSYVFDSFECAISMLAPTCKHCRCLVTGQGLENNGVVYCSSHCALMDGLEKLVVRA